MIFATFDQSGRPTAFYHEDVHGKRTRNITRDVVPENIRKMPYVEVIGEEPNPDCLIPAEAVAISEEQWLKWIGA